jgi:peptidoglycan/xylan/chitin deacetylase (PgdA/CDA1 family)
MIGVLVDLDQRDVAREFFELFKTPWEFYDERHQYEVLLCAGGVFPPPFTERLTVIYGARPTEWDEQSGLKSVRTCNDASIVQFGDEPLPLYGRSIRFEVRGKILLSERNKEECAGFSQRLETGSFARVGYDLFFEIQKLLTEGQPFGNAEIPTLELHIDVLRTVIRSAGVELVEIPPIPEGFQFIVSLTHDVDHPSLRAHQWDHTFFGFLYRATLGSLKRFVIGQLAAQQVLVNWLAVLKAFLIPLGLAKDFWLGFAEKYLEMENGVSSTFFVIPYKGIPGQTRTGQAPVFRASGYGARQIEATLCKLQQAGDEISLHGIDAWIDSAKGKDELREVESFRSPGETGVRMHWLYFDRESPRLLEEAGASYDSTVGYNEAVGYRAGTTQVYKPFETQQLLELPLHLMDTALFYPTRMELSREQAIERIEKLYENVERFGGVLTVNWHDRSVLPERLWNDVYSGMLADLKSKGAWFATAGQTVAWFRKRRSASFKYDEVSKKVKWVEVTAPVCSGLPELQVRSSSNLEIPIV